MWEEGVCIYDTPGVPNNFPLNIPLVFPIFPTVTILYIYIYITYDEVVSSEKKNSNELGKQIYWRYRRKNKYWELVEDLIY